MATRRKPIRRLLGRVLLTLFGWRVLEPFPTVPNYVLIGAPHTSWWDFPVMMAIAWRMELDLHWVGKHTLFRPPVGWLFRALGGLPVERGARSDVVGQLAAEFDRRDAFVLAIAPEGTRGKAPHWKTGFYWIARAAKVPIAMGFMDFGRRVGGIGPLLDASEPLETIAGRLEAFYADKQGRHPELFTNRVLPPPPEAD